MSEDEDRDQNDKKPMSPGTVVRLKAGGPQMTVEREEGSKIVCTWFVGNDESGWSGPYWESFSPTSLEPVPSVMERLAKATKDFPGAAKTTLKAE